MLKKKIILNRMRSFVTGSYAYGKPNSKSDIDVVVLVSPSDLKMLREASDATENNEYLDNVPCSTPLRFGTLNLICTISEKVFHVWRLATIELKKQKPVTRDVACTFMERARMQAGIQFVKQKPELSRRESQPEEDLSF
jgi:predicted nucleotidyltransferase